MIRKGIITKSWISVTMLDNYLIILRISSSEVEESQRTVISQFLFKTNPGTVTILYFFLNELISWSL